MVYDIISVSHSRFNADLKHDSLIMFSSFKQHIRRPLELTSIFFFRFLKYIFMVSMERGCCEGLVLNYPTSKGMEYIDGKFFSLLDMCWHTFTHAAAHTGNAPIIAAPP